MNFKLFVTSLALGCGALATQACSADTTPSNEGATEEEMKGATSSLVGAFNASGRRGAPPYVEGLVFQADGTFFADFDSGIRCIQAPCPTHERVAGTFRVTKSTIDLAPGAGEKPSGYYGTYFYTLLGERLLLSRADASGKEWTAELSKQGSYCKAESDCWSQNLVHPQCLGGWKCGESAPRACSWSCEDITVPRSDVWPADATGVEASSNGGGRGAPPAGSTCTIGAQSYKLDRASKKVSWTFCKFLDWARPLELLDGTKTLTDAELAQVEAALDAVKVTKQEICGADKPYKTLTVTSPSQGTQTYLDSFYACEGKGTYVDNIDEVFSAFRTVLAL